MTEPGCLSSTKAALPSSYFACAPVHADCVITHIRDPVFTFFHMCLRSFFQQLIVALDFCHEMGISHRDIRCARRPLCIAAVPRRGRLL
jgi:hypothetical protein